MSFIPSVFRVLIGAVVLLGASLVLNLDAEIEHSEAVLALRAAQAKEKCVKIDGKRVCGKNVAKKKKKNDDDDDDDDDKVAKPAQTDQRVLTQEEILWGDYFTPSKPGQ